MAVLAEPRAGLVRQHIEPDAELLLRRELEERIVVDELGSRGIHEEGAVRQRVDHVEADDATRCDR